MTDVETWLRTTIPGIILLGAIGSILAIIVLKISALIARRLFSLFTKLLPSTAKSLIEFVKKQSDRALYHLGYELGSSVGAGLFGLISFFAFHLSRAVFWFMLAVFFALCAVILLRDPQGLLLNVASYSALVLAMLTFLWACRHLYTISLAHKARITVAVDGAIAQERLRIRIQKKLSQNGEQPDAANEAGATHKADPPS